ncbi:unnamed protein product [Cochlearia groenlandica]
MGDALTEDNQNGSVEDENKKEEVEYEYEFDDLTEDEGAYKELAMDQGEEDTSLDKGVKDINKGGSDGNGKGKKCSAGGGIPKTYF